MSDWRDSEKGERGGRREKERWESNWRGSVRKERGDREKRRER